MSSITLNIQQIVKRIIHDISLHSFLLICLFIYAIFFPSALSYCAVWCIGRRPWRPQKEEENSRELIIFIQPTRWEYKSVEQKRKKRGKSGPVFRSFLLLTFSANRPATPVTPVTPATPPAPSHSIEIKLHQMKRHLNSTESLSPRNWTLGVDVRGRRTARQAAFNWLFHFIFSSWCRVTKLCHVLSVELHTSFYKLDDVGDVGDAMSADKTAPSSATFDSCYLVAGWTFSVELIHITLSLNHRN